MYLCSWTMLKILCLWNVLLYCLINKALRPVTESRKTEGKPGHPRLGTLWLTWHYDHWTWTTRNGSATFLYQRLFHSPGCLPSSRKYNVLRNKHCSRLQESASHTGFKIAHMYDDTLELVRAWSSELKILFGVLTSAAVCVRKHLQFQREWHLSVNLGGNAVELLKTL